MMSRDEKCVVLGQLWAECLEMASENEDWSDFFASNDVSLPLSYGVYMGYVEIVPGSELEEYIDETWVQFCDLIEIDKDGDYVMLTSAFDASHQPPLKDVGGWSLANPPASEDPDGDIEASIEDSGAVSASDSTDPRGADAPVEAASSAHRFCSECGAARDLGDRFCTECGTGF